MKIKKQFNWRGRCWYIESKYFLILLNVFTSEYTKTFQRAGKWFRFEKNSNKGIYFSVPRIGIIVLL